ncbi:hemE, partial [Symbiodinium microadriaticum]
MMLCMQAKLLFHMLSPVLPLPKVNCKRTFTEPSFLQLAEEESEVVELAVVCGIVRPIERPCYRFRTVPNESPKESMPLEASVLLGSGVNETIVPGSNPFAPRCLALGRCCFCSLVISGSGIAVICIAAFHLQASDASVQPPFQLAQQRVEDVKRFGNSVALIMPSSLCKRETEYQIERSTYGQTMRIAFRTSIRARRTDAGEIWLKEHPKASRELLELLSEVIIEYLSAQARAGCKVLQVFEAMGEHISPENFNSFALPAMRRIAEGLKERHPEVPLMVFPRGACYALTDLQTAGYDVVTVDTATDLAEASSQLKAEAAKTGGRVANLQGNFDPKWLRPSEGSTEEDDIYPAVKRFLTESGLNKTLKVFEK